MTSISKDHAKMVMELAKPGQDILDDMGPVDMHDLHMALGIAGEAGEVVDVVKKVIMYGKEDQLPKLIEELGDLEYYLEGLRASVGITREMTLENNISKLRQRYSSGSYSNEQAMSRKDEDAA